MTSHDLRWPFPVPLSISGTRIITDEIIFHNTESIGWFWLVYTKQEAFQYFPIGLQFKGHKSGLTSGHRYKNFEIYKLHILVPLLKPKEKRLISQKLALVWLQTFLRWGQQTASGGLTWPDPATFFVKICAMNVKEKSPSMSFQSCDVWQWHKKNLKGGGGLKAPPARNRVNWRDYTSRFVHRAHLDLLQRTSASAKTGKIYMLFDNLNSSNVTFISAGILAGLILF